MPVTFKQKQVIFDPNIIEPSLMGWHQIRTGLCNIVDSVCPEKAELAWIHLHSTEVILILHGPVWDLLASKFATFSSLE